MKALENVAMRRLRWGLHSGLGGCSQGGWVNTPKAFANSKAILRRQIPTHNLSLHHSQDQVSKTYIEPVVKIATTLQSAAFEIRINSETSSFCQISVPFTLSCNSMHFKWGCERHCWLLTQLDNEVLAVNLWILKHCRQRWMMKPNPTDVKAHPYTEYYILLYLKCF